MFSIWSDPQDINYSAGAESVCSENPRLVRSFILEFQKLLSAVERLQLAEGWR